MDQLPRLGKRELICLLFSTCGFCLERFPLPLGAWDGLRHFIVTLPEPSIYYSAINKYLSNKWQLVWDTAVDNKLHSIKSILGEWRPALRTDRKEEVVFARLRIGHSFITHSYLLKGEGQPTCVPCETSFTIKHILLHCVDFQNSHDKYYNVNTLKETVEIHNILTI